VRKAEKNSTVLGYSQSSTDTEGKIIIIDYILYSGMERDRE